jgi:hypothetical protein
VSDPLRAGSPSSPEVPPDAPTPDPVAAASSVTARSVTTLSRELADFLVEFSIVLHKRAMYPAGHPHLQDSAARFVDRLESLLKSRGHLVIGVARHQLIIAGVATDPKNALLSDLARRLHRHRIATLRFESGVGLSELDDLLSELSGDPAEEHGPLGMRPERSASWPHIKILAPELNRLLLNQDDDGSASSSALTSSAGELWVGLANLALASEGVAPTGEEDPLVVARAIDSQVGQVAYDRVVLDYLGQMADEMSGRPAAWEARVRERVSRMVASLHPDSLRRLLEAGADHAERRRFALVANEVLAVDAVMEVLGAAAATTGQSISHHLLRLLHKFAHHAEHGNGTVREEAEWVLRKNVEQLIANWSLEDPNPTEYTAVLDAMVRQRPADPSLESDQVTCEPETVLLMGLETDCLGPRVYAALDQLVETRRLGRVAEILNTVPDAKVTDTLWRHIATPARLSSELKAPGIDFVAVEGLATRLGGVAVEPLLDLLESASDTSTRARALKLLVTIGPAAAVPATARLPRAPWYVQRNILVLLRELKAWPLGFSAIPYARNPDVRVRREAFKLLLENPQHRTSALSHGLEDTDDDIIRLVLRAALESCPPEALRALERFVGDTRRSPELRSLAIRILGRASGPQALPRLLELAGARRSLLGWRLGPKSPVVVAAVATLARHWGADPEVANVLALAREHSDPEIRLAAQIRYA